MSNMKYAAAAAATLGVLLLFFGATPSPSSSNPHLALSHISKPSPSNTSLSAVDLLVASSHSRDAVGEFVAEASGGTVVRIATTPKLQHAKGIVVLFHGCACGSHTWFEQPEERVLLEEMVSKGLLAVAVTANSASADYHRPSPSPAPGVPVSGQGIPAMPLFPGAIDLPKGCWDTRVDGTSLDMPHVVKTISALRSVAYLVRKRFQAKARSRAATPHLGVFRSSTTGLASVPLSSTRSEAAAGLDLSATTGSGADDSKASSSGSPTVGSSLGGKHYLPLYGLGGSSGGYFLSALATLVQFDAIGLYVSSLPPPVQQAIGPDGRVFHTPTPDLPDEVEPLDVAAGRVPYPTRPTVYYPPTVMVHMPLDTRGAAAVADSYTRLHTAGVNTKVLECRPQPFTPELCDRMLPVLKGAPCATTVSKLQRLGVLHEDGRLAENPRNPQVAEEVQKSLDVFVAWSQDNRTPALDRAINASSASAVSTAYSDGSILSMEADEGFRWSSTSGKSVVTQRLLAAFLQVLNRCFAGHEFCAEPSAPVVDFLLAHKGQFPPVVGAPGGPSDKILHAHHRSSSPTSNRRTNK